MGVQFPDGRLEPESQLADGSAFAQQEPVICFEPAVGETLNHQVTQHQEDRLQSHFDAKLLAQSKKQSRVNAFVCKPILLRLASDILSLTLSAVKSDARVHDKSDMWSTPYSNTKVLLLPSTSYAPKCMVP